MATLELDGWELESAEERHAQAPHRFQIPSSEERTTLQAGQRVQLLFLLLESGADPNDPIMCERMWVTVNQASSTGYVGTLDSMPVSSDALQPGDQIEFGPQHVCSVLIPKTDPRHPEYKPGT